MIATPIKKVIATLTAWTEIREHKNNFILYKIVDSNIKNNVEHFKLQCINTKAIFNVLLQDIVFDPDLLYGLHPIQGCYIGIKYANIFRIDVSKSKLQRKSGIVFTKYSASRYGNKQLMYQKRDGLLGFTCKLSGEQYVMDPCDIALTRELIEEFDVVQAFCIGVLAGFRFDHYKKTSPFDAIVRAPHLRLVKN